MDEKRLRLYLRLHLADGVGAVLFGRLVETFGDIEQFWSASPERWRKVEKVGEKAIEAIKAAVGWKRSGQVEKVIAAGCLAERMGDELICLVDDVLEDKGIGRFYGQAPHIDSVCHISNCKGQVGEFIRTKVVGSENYDLIVEQIYD